MSTSTGEASPGLPEQFASGAIAAAWTLDPVRSTVALKSKSMRGLLPIRGVFREVEGAGTVTAGGQVSGQLAVKTASLDTRIGKRDEHLRSGDFFASDTYPAITFALAGVEFAATGMTVSGTLTVRDQSRPLSFPATAALAGAGEVCLDATVHVDRTEFGSSSSCHCVTRPAGAITSVRSASPRSRSSARISLASMVLPSPTSSARIARPRILRSATRAACT